MGGWKFYPEWAIHNMIWTSSEKIVEGPKGRTKLIKTQGHS